MTAVKVHDHCPGCGVCARPNVCPTNAISIAGGKAVIGDACIECGLCIPACPIGVITADDSSKKMTAQEQPELVETPTPPVEAVGEEDDHGETSTGA